MILSNGILAGRRVDLRIADGTIVEVGSVRRERAHGPAEAEVDLGGRWVIPGLWDEHVHFTQWALVSRRIDLGAARSAAAAAAIVADSAPDDGLIIGANFRAALWTDSPSLAVLDAATGDRPAILISADLHAVWLNSAALAQFGHSGHPTGLLREGEAFAVQQHLATVPVSKVDEWARSAARAAAARGVVGIVDLEMAWNLGDWQRRIAAGHTELRVDIGVYAEHLERAIAEGLVSGRAYGELLTVAGFKVLTDGSLNTRTASTEQPYADGSHGVLTVPPEHLLPLMRRAAGAGIRPLVHAIGDRANGLALDAFEAIGSGGRIEHAQLLRDADLPRFARLGVAASVQPQHLLDDRDASERIWPDRTARLYAFRALLDAGARLRFGSDAPVTPLDPWLAIAAAVTRSQEGDEPWHPEQRITVAEAIAASSRSTVAVGQPADLAILDADPERADPHTVRTMPVAGTLLAGRVTHGAGLLRGTVA